MDVLSHSPAGCLSAQQGPLSCQVTVTVAQPGGNWALCAPWNLAVEPRPVSQISSLLSHKGLRRGGGVVGKRSQAPAPPPASSLADLLVSRFSGSTPFSSTFTHSLSGALEPRHLLPEQPLLGTIVLTMFKPSGFPHSFCRYLDADTFRVPLSPAPTSLHDLYMPCINSHRRPKFSYTCLGLWI